MNNLYIIAAILNCLEEEGLFLTRLHQRRTNTADTLPQQ